MGEFYEEKDISVLEGVSPQITNCKGTVYPYEMRNLDGPLTGLKNITQKESQPGLQRLRHMPCVRLTWFNPQDHMMPRAFIVWVIPSPAGNKQ